MKLSIAGSFAMAALLLAGLQSTLRAQETGESEHTRNLPIEGVWVVNVTVRDCQSGNLIRSLRALNLYIHDGSMTETAVNAEAAVNVPRTPSVGTWTHVEGRRYAATLNFFRHDADGTFVSRAKVTRTIELKQDGKEFTVTGTVQDFDANNNLLSTGCSSEAGTRSE